MLTIERPEEMLETALSALGNGDGHSALDDLDAPIYATDAEGRVIYWNKACVAFAGREPQVGKDRWCVTWRLYTTDGIPLPHDRCPMARAIKEQRCIRNEIAIAMRPDGSRVAFRAYPTLLFNAEGALTGEINMLVDITGEQAGVLVEQAARCRRLAQATHDVQTCDILKTMASGYEEMATALHPG
jgi:PAS domain-containing protein